jgi:hypothetical protein
MRKLVTTSLYRYTAGANIPGNKPYFNFLERKLDSL